MSRDTCQRCPGTSQCGRCRIRTCVGIHRRIYSPGARGAEPGSSEATLRNALFQWSFNSPARSTAATEAVAQDLRWIASHSLTIDRLSEPSTLHRALDASPASEPAPRLHLDDPEEAVGPLQRRAFRGRAGTPRLEPTRLRRLASSSHDGDRRPSSRREPGNGQSAPQRGAGDRDSRRGLLRVLVLRRAEARRGRQPSSSGLPAP